VKALGSMPDETVMDGEVVALDAEGRPSVHALQIHLCVALYRTLDQPTSFVANRLFKIHVIIRLPP
jgi:hypothetical protein